MSLELKHVWHTLQCVEVEGHKIGELEALLIHSDDLFELLKEARNRSPVVTGLDYTHNSPDGFRIQGVKIIESRYVQRGSIFKIFKNEAPYSQDNDYGYRFGPKIMQSPPIMVTEKETKRHSTKRKIELD